MLGDQLPVIRDEEPAEMLPCLQRLPCFCILAVAQDVKGIGRAESKPVEPLALLAFALFGVLPESVSRIVERAALGKGNYDRKVFNNIWGTFTFGPENTVYLGAYRGFLRFWSDDEMPK